MILIHPPVAKPCEPPAGIAKLSGALACHGIGHSLIDANLEAMLYVIDNTQFQSNKHNGAWTARSLRNIAANYHAVKDPRTYANIDRYRRAVTDLNHAVEVWSGGGANAGLADYRDPGLSPLRSGDLLQAAEEPEKNPYYQYFAHRFADLVEKNGSSFAGFSLNYLSQALCTFAMIGFLKKRFPGLSIILGGGLVTSWMRNPGWKAPFGGLIDHYISGPGEEKLLAILGADFIQGNHSVSAYDTLPLDDYLAPGRILPFSASSGCYWHKCSFCPERAEDNRYIPQPADRALDSIRNLAEKTGPVLIHILDNAISPSLLRRLADGKVRVPWYGFARIDTLLTDMEFCLRLKNSGCAMLKLGLESGDQDVLDRMQKGIDLHTASVVLRTLKKAGIATYVYLIFGTPSEKPDAAQKTLDFVVRHSGHIDFLNIAMFNMPRCSPEASQYETRDFYEGDLSLYTDFVHPSGWNRKEVRQFIEHELKRDRAVASILQKQPPIFTSNHAPFFVP